MMQETGRTTRRIRIGGVEVGGGAPIAVQSMCATRTVDIDATIAQTHQLAKAGAAIVRIAMDNEKEVVALKEIRAQTRGVTLSVDLQENYRIANKVAPYVDKIRYNPGHLHHIEKAKTIQQKVKWLVDIARDNDLAIRIGVNCGSVAPAFLEKFPGDQLAAIVESTAYHCGLMDDLGFDRFVVSLKDSDPSKVLEANRRFAERRPDVPIHLGVTEAGMPPEGIIKTRVAFEQLLAQQIGDTIRVSLTLPNERKHEEVVVGHQIIKDVKAGRFISVPDLGDGPQYHFVPIVLAGRERKVRRIGAACERAHRIRRALPDNDRGDGMPGERAGRDRRRRPGPVVRADDREPQAQGAKARQLQVRRGAAATEDRSRQA